MTDDFRRNLLDEDDFDDMQEDDLSSEENSRNQQLFLGMTAVERMFLSIFFFMNVLVFGLAFLIVTNKIVF